MGLNWHSLQLHSWILLFIAIFCGVLGTSCIKLSFNFQGWKLLFTLLMLYFIAFVAMTLALQGIEMSIVYAVWSGLGTILIAFIGLFVFNEAISVKKIVSLLLILVGILGINLTNAFH